MAVCPAPSGRSAAQGHRLKSFIRAFWIFARTPDANLQAWTLCAAFRARWWALSSGYVKIARVPNCLRLVAQVQE
eukprot:1825767-Alexandrium_andersonii.AAC.1